MTWHETSISPEIPSRTAPRLRKLPLLTESQSQRAIHHKLESAALSLCSGFVFSAPTCSSVHVLVFPWQASKVRIDRALQLLRTVDST